MNNMNNIQIKLALRHHNIKHYETNENHIIAVDEYVRNGKVGRSLVDVTEWSFTKMMNWLGY